MDHTQNTVYSVNTQYAGNTVGLKKLSLRLAICKADAEGWLAEHMFIMRANGPGGRKTYLCGAYPSACGKTSTAMIPGENIVGDDLAYFRVIDGQFRTANVEAGIFGIIQDVNAEGDPVIWDVLHNPGEAIFGNVLVKDGKPYWLGMGEDIPDSGMNHVSAEWTEGMKGPDGKDTTPSHKNARYTLRMNDLENKDPDWDNPNGLPVGGIIYGGRDSDTNVPVREAYSWDHGICTMGAMLESETTAATIGAEGERKWNVMSNMDFLSMSVGKYIQNNLDFAKDTQAAQGLRDQLLPEEGAQVPQRHARQGRVGQVDGVACPRRRRGPRCRLRPDPQIRRSQAALQRGPQQRLHRAGLRRPVHHPHPRTAGQTRPHGEDLRYRAGNTPKAMAEETAAQRKRLNDLKAAKGDYISPLDL